jgi:hypothetical protein
MDPGLHVKQAINHLTKVINYAPYVEEDGAAVVALTPEDWQVVADALFFMDTPAEVFPDEITDYRLSDDRRTIELDLEDGTAVTIERA